MRSRRRGSRAVTTARRVVAAVLLSFAVARADLPTPAADVAATTATGFAYVGTGDPYGHTLDQLDPHDVAALATTRVDAPDSSTSHVETHGGISDVVHFGAGLSQTFFSGARVDGIADSRIGAVHLLAASQAVSEPISYAAPFPGALGRNPFFAEASISVGGGFVDVVTLPATADAPTQGMLTPILFGVFVNCTPTGDYPNLSGHVGASLSDGQGHVIGEIVANDPPNAVQHSIGCPFGATRSDLSAPVLTPLVLRFSAGLAAGISSGNYPDGNLGSTAGGTAVFNAINTAVATLNISGGPGIVGAGATGSTGWNYSYDEYNAGHTGPTITTTTTTSTTTTFVPPSTLASCAGICGDGVRQPDCGETCDCPPTGEMQVTAVCDAATAVPALAPSCARCVGCQIDLSNCATTTTLSTTTTTSPGGSTTTTIPATCAGLAGVPAAACRLHALLAAPLCGADPVPKKTDGHLRGVLGRAAKLLDGAKSKSRKPLARALAHARRQLARALTLATKAANAKSAKVHIPASCVAALTPAIQTVEADLPAP